MDCFRRARYFLIVILVFVFALVIWINRKENNCVVSILLPDSLVKSDFDCGYVLSYSNEFSSAYAGRILKIYSAGNSIHMVISFGKHTEDVILKEINGNRVWYSVVKKDVQKSMLDGGSLKMKDLFLDKKGIDVLSGYVGKDVLWFSTSGTKESLNMIREAISRDGGANNISENENFLGYLTRCGNYEQKLKQYLKGHWRMINFCRIQVDRWFGCRLVGSNFYIYE